jgi:hypothetical protein
MYLMIVLQAVMVSSDIQITCGSLGKISRINLEYTTSIAQFESKLGNTKKR